MLSPVEIARRTASLRKLADIDLYTELSDEGLEFMGMVVEQPEVHPEVQLIKNQTAIVIDGDEYPLNAY